MVYKVWGSCYICDVLKTRLRYLNFLDSLENDPYRYYEYILDKSVNLTETISFIYYLLITSGNSISLLFKSTNDKFIKIDLSLPEYNSSSEICISLQDIEQHLIKCINDYDTKNNTNIMEQLSQLDLFNAKCIIDTKDQLIEIFKSTREYINYHKPLDHIHLDIHVDRSKL